MEDPDASPLPHTDPLYYGCFSLFQEIGAYGGWGAWNGGKREMALKQSELLRAEHQAALKRYEFPVKLRTAARPD